MKKTALLLVFTLFMAQTPAFSQNAFWSFDEYNQQSMIPPQCDGQFDETRGGVFLPTPDELFEQGELFLLEKGQTRNNAGYCFLAAAMQDHVEAQFRVAQLYNKGVVLPQNDLAAYKWAFVAALNGHKEAEQMTLMLEQFLSAEDIELATQSVETMLPNISEAKNTAIEEQDKILSDKKAELESINNEIDLMLGIAPISVTPASLAKKSGESSETGDVIFSEEDRMKE